MPLSPQRTHASILERRAIFSKIVQEPLINEISARCFLINVDILEILISSILSYPLNNRGELVTKIYVYLRRPIHDEQQEFRGQRWRRERLLRRATTSHPRDSIACEQPEPCAFVLRHPKAAYLLHADLELLRRIGRDASRLLRRAQAAATPHPKQLGVQSHQRWIPQRIEQVRELRSFRRHF